MTLMTHDRFSSLGVAGWSVPGMTDAGVWLVAGALESSKVLPELPTIRVRGFLFMVQIRLPGLHGQFSPSHLPMNQLSALLWYDAQLECCTCSFPPGTLCLNAVIYRRQGGYGPPCYSSGSILPARNEHECGISFRYQQVI